MALSVPLRGSHRESAVAQLFSLGHHAHDSTIRHEYLRVDVLCRKYRDWSFHSSECISALGLVWRRAGIYCRLCHHPGSLYAAGMVATQTKAEGFMTSFEIGWPNKSPEPTAVGACSSAIAVHAASRRWLSFFR